MFEFLFLGNLMMEKGVLVLLDACAELQSRGADFVCHFVGAASKDISMAQMEVYVAERQLQNVVRVHGPLYGEDKESMLQLVGVLVFPTFYHNECFPFVILEAMKAGLPVISTEEGAIPDMVLDGKTGWLVERGNAGALADAMQRFISAPALASEMGTRGRELYEEKFTREIFIENVCSVLRSV